MRDLSWLTKMFHFHQHFETPHLFTLSLMKHRAALIPIIEQRNLASVIASKRKVIQQ